MRAEARAQRVKGRVQASGGQCSCSHRPSVQGWPRPPKPGVPGLGTSASALLLLSALPWHSPASFLLILPSRPFQHLLSHLLSLMAFIAVLLRGADLYYPALSSTPNAVFLVGSGRAT